MEGRRRGASSLGELTGSAIAVPAQLLALLHRPPWQRGSGSTTARVQSDVRRVCRGPTTRSWA
eukprot:scaffold201_cov121-Isochrysis_galbana.AAC.10